MGKEQDLMKAGKEGDVPAILKLVKEGADVNCIRGEDVSAVCFSPLFLSSPFLFLFFSVEFPSVA